MKKHSIIVTVMNRLGVLSRITGVLSSRGLNIESLIAAPTENSDIYKIQMVVCGTNEKVEQIMKQLSKLIDTIKVVNISNKKNYIVREFALIKVNTVKKRQEIFELIDVFKAKVVDVTRTHVTVDLSGPTLKIERFINLLKPYGIKEFVRSGHVAVGES